MGTKAPISTKIAAFASAMSALSAMFSGYIAYNQADIAGDAARKNQQAKVAADLIEAGIRTCNAVIPKSVRDEIVYTSVVLPESFAIKRRYQVPERGFDAKKILDEIHSSINESFDLRDDLLMKATVLYNWSRNPETKNYHLLTKMVLDATNPKRILDALSKHEGINEGLALDAINAAVKQNQDCEETFASMSSLYKFDFDISTYISSRH